MELDGLVADAQPLGDRLVRQPFRQQLQDLELALGEWLDDRVRLSPSRVAVRLTPDTTVVVAVPVRLTPDTVVVGIPVRLTPDPAIGTLVRSIPGTTRIAVTHVGRDHESIDIDVGRPRLGERGIFGDDVDRCRREPGAQVPTRVTRADDRHSHSACGALAHDDRHIDRDAAAERADRCLPPDAIARQKTEQIVR